MSRLPSGQAGKTPAVTKALTPPQCISLRDHRDERHLVERAARWIVVGALLAVLVAALANVFGQHHVTLVARSDGATLRVSVPGALRSGLLYQGKFQVEARDRIGKPTLVLAGDWWDAMSVNSVEPQPTRSWSRDGRVAMEFGPLGPNRTLTVYLYQQVNPTTFGRRHLGVELRDGDRTVASVDRTVHVFP